MAWYEVTGLYTAGVNHLITGSSNLIICVMRMNCSSDVVASLILSLYSMKHLMKTN